MLHPYPINLNPKPNPNLNLNSYPNPNAMDVLLRGDRDYGTAGTLLIPDKRLGVCNDKNGQVYLLNLDNLGGYQARAEVYH